jgi:Zn-dependent protease
VEELLSSDAVRRLLLFAPVLILSLSIHEWAHAWSADRLGDSTARYLGRMTVDPMAHIDWIGTVLFPGIAILTGAPLFGWAKPVPVDERNFRKPRQGMAWVAAAGPASNIVIAVFVVAMLSVLGHSQQTGILSIKAAGGMAGAGVEMALMAVQLNLFLAFFNLIPIPPLDGSRILRGLSTPAFASKIESLEGMGSWLILILFFTGVFRVLATPVFALFETLLLAFRVPI